MEKVKTSNLEEPTSGQSLQQLQKEFRDYISEAVRSKEYCVLMDPLIEQIDNNRVASINETFLFYGDDRYGYGELVELVANILNIETPKNLYIMTRSEAEKTNLPADAGGGYVAKTRSIGFVVPDGEHPVTWRIMNATRKVAHEMWHVYQHNEIDKKGERARFYQDNFDNYTCASGQQDNEAILAYIKQPIETEAYVFQEKFTRSFIERLFDSLVKERDKDIGRKAISTATGFLDDEYWFETEHEAKMKELDRLQKIIGNRESTKINK